MFLTLIGPWLLVVLAALSCVVGVAVLVEMRATRRDDKEDLGYWSNRSGRNEE